MDRLTLLTSPLPDSSSSVTGKMVEGRPKSVSPEASVAKVEDVAERGLVKYPSSIPPSSSVLIPTSIVLLLAAVDAITDIGICVVVSCFSLVDTTSGSIVVIGASVTLGSSVSMVDDVAERGLVK